MIDDLERAIEAMLFASDEPLDARQVAGRLGDEMTPGQVKAIIEAIARRHAGSGIELVERGGHWHFRSEEPTSELQSLMRISYAVFCLKNTKTSLSADTTHHPT